MHNTHHSVPRYFLRLSLSPPRALSFTTLDRKHEGLTGPIKQSHRLSGFGVRKAVQKIPTINPGVADLLQLILLVRG